MKSIGHKVVLIAVLVTCWISGYGQDIHFTQYNMSPLTLNPAVTGLFEGSIRAGALYRNQWSSISPDHFDTYQAFAEKKFPFRADDIAIGLSGVSDRSGPGRLGADMVLPSGAYHKKMGAHSFSIGVQPAIVNRSINEATYPAQYDHDIGGFDPSQPNLEQNFARKSTYFDLNAGIAWRYKTQGLELVVGQGFYHLNQPNISLFQDHEWSLPPRFTTHSRATIRLTEKWDLQPSAMFQRHNEASEFLIGSLVRKRFREALALRMGSYFRHNLRGHQSSDLARNVDAVSLNAGIETGPFNIGLAYDLNISELHRASNYRGGFELALIYTYGFEAQPDEITVPCYRY